MCVFITLDFKSTCKTTRVPVILDCKKHVLNHACVYNLRF